MTIQPAIKPTDQQTLSSSFCAEIGPNEIGDRPSPNRKRLWFSRFRRKPAHKPAMEQPQTPWQSRVALWLARTINPPVRPKQDFQVDLKQLRQLPDATLGRELAYFLDHHHFEPLQTGDWLQKTHDIWHVVTGLSPSEEDEYILQAFVRSQVFRPSSAIVVLAGLLSGKLRWHSLQRSLKLGRVAHNIAQWDIEADWGTPLEDVREKLGLHRRGIGRQTKGFQGH